MIDKNDGSVLEKAAWNSSMVDVLKGCTPGSVMAWHRGAPVSEGDNLQDMTTLGAEIADLMPSVARSLEYHVLMLDCLDDVDGVHMDGCKVIAALLKRLTPEIELLASLPDALNTRA